MKKLQVIVIKQIESNLLEIKKICEDNEQKIRFLCREDVDKTVKDKMREETFGSLIPSTVKEISAALEALKESLV